MNQLPELLLPEGASLPPEVVGYIQGLKDLISAHVEAIALKSAEAHVLREQLADARRELDQARAFRDAITNKNRAACDLMQAMQPMREEALQVIRAMSPDDIRKFNLANIDRIERKMLALSGGNAEVARIEFQEGAGE